MMKKDPVELYGYSILSSMIKKEYKVLGAWPVRGQKYFNFALALQDERLTILTRPANTCTRP